MFCYSFPYGQCSMQYYMYACTELLIGMTCFAHPKALSVTSTVYFLVDRLSVCNSVNVILLLCHNLALARKSCQVLSMNASDWHVTY